MSLALATIADLPELVDMAHAAHRESRYAHWPFDDNMACQAFMGGMQPQGMLVKYVIDHKIAGFFLAAPSSMEFSPRTMGVESSWWVRPEYRKTRAALALVKTYIDWCSENRMPGLATAHFGYDNEAASRIYQKCGMKEIGKVFLWEPSH